MSITADVYCEELERMMKKLACLQQALVNRSFPLLFHRQRATPYCATDSLQAARAGVGSSLSSTILTRPCTYRLLLFRNFFRGIKFNAREAVQNAFEEFVATRPADFLQGHHKLPMPWQRYVDCMGDYFE
ncbi:jg25797 [Pararge aegeria aegeria]|uniref:Jg25797 protein n=1 Tax=Pararge aegeria aegeria TaxID=348720 RepID=A0A8S4QS02_9NEOP|nr:jg25797 [Pararge aegeria aegeria]